MFCIYCGKEIDDNSLICIHCGVPVFKPNVPAPAPAPAQKSGSHFGFSVSSFILSIFSLFMGMFTLIPAVGLSLGMVGLSRSGKGNKLGISGVVINAVALLGWVAFWVIGILNDFLGWGL